MKRLLCISVVLLLTIFSQQGRAGGGKTGLTFLKLGAGTRSGGMGDAAVAVVNDASALFWNPARMSDRAGMEIEMTHTQWVQGISHEFAGGVWSNGKYAVGTGLILLSIDGIERRADIPTAQPLATFSAYDVAFAVSFARRLTDGLSVGMTVKGIAEKILYNSATGMALDFGAAWRSPGRTLMAGAILRNIGSDMAFIQEKFPLPAEWRVGAGFAPSRLSHRAVFSLDMSRYRAEPVRLNAGGEYVMQSRFSVMAGYRAGQDTAGMTAGLRVHLNRYRLDYAYAPYSDGLGATHRFGLGARW